MMPQLDFATFPSQLFWLAVNFALLYVLMAKFALPRIGQILQTRAAAIKSDLDAAQNLRSESESILAAYDRAITDAKNRARYLIKQAQDEITFETEKQLAASEQKLAARLRDAEQKMQAAKTKLLADIKPMSNELADMMVQKLLQGMNDNGADMPRLKARG